jgi:hypothetical protein
LIERIESVNIHTSLVKHHTIFILFLALAYGAGHLSSSRAIAKRLGLIIDAIIRVGFELIGDEITFVHFD